jgi:hypothetical protein
VWQIAEPLLEPGGRLLFMKRTAVHAQQGGQAETSAPPCGSRVVRQQVQIPGLTGSHEVLLLEARA